MELAPSLYQKYFVDTRIERFELFSEINKNFECVKVLYPGSFVHITPSFCFPEVVYLDMDKRCKKFYSAEETKNFVEMRKRYKENTIIRFYEMSFEENIPEKEEYFDLIISQYSGFISKYCTKYLKRNGFLVANDSHGDATLAYTSGEFELVGTINDDFKLNKFELDEYFKLRKNKEIDLDVLLKEMKGPKYTRMCNSYIFSKK